jgi:hypothetical protein
METVRIRDGKKSDPGSGINIPDPQHWEPGFNCRTFGKSTYLHLSFHCKKWDYDAETGK